MYFKFSSVPTDFKKKGRKVATFFKFIILGIVHFLCYFFFVNINKFPINPFPNVDPLKFNKLNKKRVTEDYVHINLEKQGCNFATFFKFINLSGLHSHTYYTNIHLFKKFIEKFIEETPQLESNSKDDFIEDWG